jgi:hypothetical protein
MYNEPKDTLLKSVFFVYESNCLHPLIAQTVCQDGLPDLALHIRRRSVSDPQTSVKRDIKYQSKLNFAKHN